MTISLSEKSVTRAELVDVCEIPATPGSLGVPAPPVAALATARISALFPIQAVTLPYALAGLAERVTHADVITGPHAAGRSACHRSQRSRRRR